MDCILIDNPKTPCHCWYCLANGCIFSAFQTFSSHNWASILTLGGLIHKYCQYQYNTLSQALETLSKWGNFLDLQVGKIQK